MTNDYWGEWQEAVLDERTVARIKEVQPDARLPHTIFRNRVYEVWVTRIAECVWTPFGAVGAPFPRVVWLSIKRLDRRSIHDWRELQRIKNELCGEDCEGVELYPAEDRHVDTSNQYHLWVFPNNVRLPFGYGDRLVLAPGQKMFPGDKSVQRPFGPTHRQPDGGGE